MPRSSSTTTRSFAIREFEEWRTTLPLDEDELLAAQAGVGIRNFRRFPGNVGTMANGAGLAMATMDAVANAGGQVADFLDVGGGANAQRVRNCYELVVNNTGANVFFINIFGGITRGDEVARGIVTAMNETASRKIPLVIRLTGTNEEEGRRYSRAGRDDAGRNDGRRRARSRAPLAGAHKRHVDFRRQEQPSHRAGDHRRRRLVSRGPHGQIRNESRWRRHAGKGRPDDAAGTSGLRHRSGGRRRDRRHAHVHLRPAAVCRRRALRSVRCRHHVCGLHHRGRSGARYAQSRRHDPRHADHRPELSRARLAGKIAGRHHAGPRLQGGRRSGLSPGRARSPTKSSIY